MTTNDPKALDPKAWAWVSPEVQAAALRIAARFVERQAEQAGTLLDRESFVAATMVLASEIRETLKRSTEGAK